jgi:hypothetical protein
MSRRLEYIMRYDMNSKEHKHHKTKMANEWKNGWNGNKENTGRYND